MTDSVMRIARVAVIEALYESETSGHRAEEAFERRLSAVAAEDSRLARRPGPAAFARHAISGIAESREQIDGMIQQAAPLYPVQTLAVVDRNILRLAIWELLADKAAPVAAVVNEAVELARRYGSDSSPGFVNGVLRTISKRIEGDRALADRANAPATHQE